MRLTTRDVIFRTLLPLICAVVSISFPAVGDLRTPYSERDAWGDASVLIVRGTVLDITYKGKSPEYEFQVSEVLKPREGGLAPTIVISDPYFNTMAAIKLKKGTDFVVFLRRDGEHFRLLREIDVNSDSGAQVLAGLRTFLSVMFTNDAAKQQQMCLSAWNSGLSDPEKKAVLDAMWDTKTPKYSELLLTIAKGADSPPIRAWAITILSYVGRDHGVAELVPMLLDDSDYEVRRQLLLLFGTYRVQSALPAIDTYLKAREQDTLPAWQQEALRSMAEEARDKITGKNTSPYWKN